MKVLERVAGRGVKLWRLVEGEIVWREMICSAQREARRSSSDRPPSQLRVVSFQLADVSQQFIEVSDTDEVPADHFVSSQRRLLAGPQGNQHACDDRAIGLNLDSVLRTAQQVPATKDLFEETEED